MEAVTGSVKRRQEAGAVYGVALNGSARNAVLADHLAEPPKAPVLYMKTPNTLAPSGRAVGLPPGVERVQVEGTLAVTFADGAVRRRREDALQAITGCAAAIDLQLVHDSLHRPAVREQCRDDFLPMGAWTAWGEADIADLAVATRVNGETRAVFRLADLVRPLPVLIEAVTDFMSFHPGDVLLVTASPSGVEARAGDTVTVEIAGIGVASCTLAASESG